MEVTKPKIAPQREAFAISLSFLIPCSKAICPLLTAKSKQTTDNHLNDQVSKSQNHLSTKCPDTQFGGKKERNYGTK